MEALAYIFDFYRTEITLGMGIAIILLLIGLIIQNYGLFKLRKKYKKMFKGENIQDIESLLLKNKEELGSIKSTHEGMLQDISRLDRHTKTCFSKSAMHKYDAFTGLAGRLSFVYAILDSQNNGMLLNGIYSSEGHYLYIKDVKDGKTEKELSKEEKLTLEAAIMKQQ